MLPIAGRCGIETTVGPILMRGLDTADRGSQLLCSGSTELAAPSPDRFVGDNVAAFQKHFLHQPQAQRKPEIKPHGMGKDRWWKTMVLVADD